MIKLTIDKRYYTQRFGLDRFNFSELHKLLDENDWLFLFDIYVMYWKDQIESPLHCIIHFVHGAWMILITKGIQVPTIFSIVRFFFFIFFSFFFFRLSLNFSLCWSNKLCSFIGYMYRTCHIHTHKHIEEKEREHPMSCSNKRVPFS